MESVSERFLRYVSYNTRSDEFCENCPSTEGQRVLGDRLVEEMQAMGIVDAHMDENGYIYGTVPGDPNLPTIGLIAHMDTAPDMSGANVKPQVICYNGGDILLNKAENIIMKEVEFASLAADRGKTLIVTDGTTLLGADNKAGIAEILACAQYLLENPVPHATLKIAFTPDEEIGRGADLFDVAGFGAQYAYTVDGGALGELEYENFNAAGAKITVFGRNIHPGSAKNQMVNSQYIAMEFHGLLPVSMRPEHTEGYEGFYHLIGMQGDVESSCLRYIIRDHDMGKFQAMKEKMGDIADFLNKKYGDGTVCLEINDSYYNMKEKIEPCMYVVDRAKQAMENVGITPITVPIRGGTDGARLSFMGLPCPNLCTGGENFHSRFEFLSIEALDGVVDIVERILYNAVKE